MQLCRRKFKNSFILSNKKWIKCIPGKIRSNRGKNLELSLPTSDLRCRTPITTTYEQEFPSPNIPLVAQCTCTVGLLRNIPHSPLCCRGRQFQHWHYKAELLPRKGVTAAMGTAGLWGHLDCNTAIHKHLQQPDRGLSRSSRNFLTPFGRIRNEICQGRRITCTRKACPKAAPRFGAGQRKLPGQDRPTQRPVSCLGPDPGGTAPQRRVQPKEELVVSSAEALWAGADAGAGRAVEAAWVLC